MLITNPQAVRIAYPESLHRILDIRTADESREWLSHWPLLNPGATPLRELPGLAQQLGIARLYVKDESCRSPLGSFKALGAPIALLRLVMRVWDDRTFDASSLFAGRHRSLLEGLTVISATDGNHGRALAAAARSMGCRCVIVLHANVDAERERAIAAYGARIVRIQGDYDASVAEAATLASANGWHVVSDTSYEGYEEIPRDVMQGYGTIAAESIGQAAPEHGRSPFTHVLLQGGVGGLAAGVASYLWERYAQQRPVFVVVEPTEADCLFQSVIARRPTRASGKIDSVMAGLACGEASPLAWKLLEHCIDHFMTIDDSAAIEAMHTLAAGSVSDIPVVAGESGAAGLAGLTGLARDVACARSIGIDATSRALVINTEGATAPALYQRITGESPESVLARQIRWLADRLDRTR